jgi:hypothetical protein
MGSGLAAVVVSVLLGAAAVYWGATTQEVLIGLGTGLFSGAVVTIAVSDVDTRREAEYRRSDAERQEAYQAEAQRFSRRLAVEVAPTLENAHLEGQDLSGFNLAGKILRGAHLQGDPTGSEPGRGRPPTRRPHRC